MKREKDIRTQIAVVFFVLFMLIVAISTFQNASGYTTSYFGSRGNVSFGIKVKEEPKEITIYDPDGNIIQQTTLEEDQTTIKLPRTTYESQTVDGKTLYFQGWIKDGVVSRVYGPNETVDVSGGETFTPYYAEDPDYSGFTFTIDEETGEYILAGADSSITSAEIPTLKEGQIVSVVGDNGFYRYLSLQTVTLPQTITKIGDYAFYDCSNLTSINIPDSVTSIGDFAFYDCLNLTSINIPDSVTSIGDYAFACCSNLTSITIPDGVTSIPASCFLQCRNLTIITIPNSVTSIGYSAFQFCTSLQSITIPKNVTEIEICTFMGCSKLTSVTFENTTGWHKGSTTGTSIDVTNPTTNAKNMTTDKGSDDWCYPSLYRVDE